MIVQGGQLSPQQVVAGAAACLLHSEAAPDGLLSACIPDLARLACTTSSPQACWQYELNELWN